MSTRTTILEYLGYGPQTSYALSVLTGVAQPSVRRTIALLRDQGWTITSEGTGLDAAYRLYEAGNIFPPTAFDTDINVEAC